MNNEIAALLKHQHNSGVYWSKTEPKTYSQSVKDIDENYYLFYFNGTGIVDTNQFLLKFCETIEAPEPEACIDNFDVFLDYLRGISYYHNDEIITHIIIYYNVNDFAFNNQALFNEIVTVFGFATKAWYDRASDNRLYILMTGERDLKPEIAVLEI
ncbi:MAG: hypothetical protein ABI690_32770 [Chloroflexota bacterium]